MSSSSRKGKKSNSDKPKQPQRGLGVAQLEKLRLHGQLPNINTTSSYHHPSPNYPSNFIQEDHMRIQTYSALPSSSFSYSSSSMASSASYGFSPNIMMGHEGTNIRYGDSQPSTTTSWINPGNSFIEAQYYGQPAGAARPFLNLQLEETHPRKSKKNRSSSMGSSSQNSESSDSQELDLELRLSI